MAATTIKRTGFGQVEPNHLSAPRNGKIYAQLPAKSTIAILENGQFAKYDYANKEVNFTGDGEWLLVYNEKKLYDERKQEDRYFAMVAKNYVDKEMVPRLFKTDVGDIYTTNMVGAGNTGDDVDYAGIALDVGDVLTPNANGVLNVGTGDMEWKVVEVYTMPDGQPGVKLQRIK